MKKSKKILIGLVAVFGLLIILPFLIPTSHYITQFEREASEMLGAPVHVGNAHIYFIPTPRLTIESVTVGKSQDVQVQSLTVIPSIASLFSESRSIAVTVDQPVIKDSAIPLITKLMVPKSGSKTIPTIEVTQIQVDALQLVWPTIDLPALNLQANFTKGMQFQDAEITSEDGQLQADVKPLAVGHSITIKIQDWMMPLSTPLRVDHGRADMVLLDHRLDISKYSMQMYGGSLNGNAKLDWKKSWQLNGQLYVKNVSLTTPTKMMNPRIYLGGGLDGNGRFGANAKSVDRLLNQLRAEFTFTVNQGVLYGVDLVKVASLLVKQSAKGGQTQFDTFTGQLAVSGKRYQLKNMHVSSGLISAKGNVKINEQKKLDGAGEVALRQSVGIVSVPLVVSGTLDDPLVYPSKAALAGAAVGTAILGPGLGTSLGSKAGSALGGLKDLFGGGDE